MGTMHYEYNGPQHCDFCARLRNADAVSALCAEAYDAAAGAGYPVRGERLPDGRSALRVALDGTSGSLCPDFTPLRLEELVPRVGREDAGTVYGLFPARG